MRIGVTGGDTLRLGGAAPVALAALSEAYESWLPDIMNHPQGKNRMIPFVIVKTKAGFAYLRPEHVVAVNATNSAECLILMTDGVTIAAIEPAEDVVARLEAEAQEEDDAAEAIKEHNRHGHVPNRD